MKSSFKVGQTYTTKSGDKARVVVDCGDYFLGIVITRISFTWNARWSKDGKNIAPCASSDPDAGFNLIHPNKRLKK